MSKRLTNAELERLAVLSEECGEVIQVIGKIIRHEYEAIGPEGEKYDNRKALEEEIGHINFMVWLMIENSDVKQKRIDYSTQQKSSTIWKYLRHQKRIKYEKK